jgi:hypothetical protein
LERLTLPRCTGKLSFILAYCSSVISITDKLYELY